MDFMTALPVGTGKPPSGIDNFDTAVAAEDFSPIREGQYVARVVRGECCTTRKRDDAYRMRYEILEGPETGKTQFKTWTFGEKALPYSKRDLAIFGLTSKAKLLCPFPEPGREYVVKLFVALQTGDDGIRRNDVKKVELLKIVDSPANKFQLPPGGEGGYS